MDALLLDHFQWLVVILYNYMPAIDVCIKLLNAKAHQQTLLLNVSVKSVNISKCFTSECYGLPTFYQGSP